MSRNKSTSKQLRIIGGKYKGRKVRFDGDDSLRPTLGRVRETLFNWLRPHVDGTSVLDVFAGSGALGLEALSQGAFNATFVDQSRRTCTALRAAMAELDVGDSAAVLCQDALGFLQNTDQSFDLVFVDPPFREAHLLEQTCALIAQRNTRFRYIYAEAATAQAISSAADKANLEVVKSTHAGETHAALLTRPAGDFECPT